MVTRKTDMQSLRRTQKGESPAYKSFPLGRRQTLTPQNHAKKMKKQKYNYTNVPPRRNTQDEEHAFKRTFFFVEQRELGLKRLAEQAERLLHVAVPLFALHGRVHIRVHNITCMYERITYGCM